MSAASVRRAVVATGEGRYADPWHPFPETTGALREILTSRGFTVTVAPVDDALAHLSGADLLVVNAGDPWRDEIPAVGAPDEAVSGVDAALKRGIGVLAMHSSLSSLRDYPAWAPAVGGVWLPGVSMHPPISDAEFAWSPHPLAGDEPLRAFDERYAYLQAVGTSEVVATHEHDDVSHPVVWVREHRSSRVAVDLLGHDARSYESAAHRALIGRLIDWVTGR